MKSTRHLGVSFCNGRIQLAEIEQGKKPALLALAEAETSVDFVQAGIHLSAEHPQVATLAGELGDLIKRNKVGSKVISYALPSDPVFINIIPMAVSLQGSAQAQFLQWEIAQYFPGAKPKEFILDSHPLPTPDKTVKPTFVVGVRRGMVSFLQRVTNDLGLTLQFIDVDHLCTEKTLQFNYPEIVGHNVALVSVRFGAVNMSIIRDGEIIDYRTYQIQVPAEIPKAVVAYLKQVKEHDGVAPPDVIFLNGLDVPAEVVKQIRTKADAQIVVVNSVRKLPVSGKVYQPFVKESYRFAAAIGLGLRTS